MGDGSERYVNSYPFVKICLVLILFGRFRERFC